MKRLATFLVMAFLVVAPVFMSQASHARASSDLFLPEDPNFCYGGWTVQEIWLGFSQDGAWEYYALYEVCGSSGQMNFVPGSVLAMPVMETYRRSVRGEALPGKN
jgi:hypothetical protein